MYFSCVKILRLHLNPPPITTNRFSLAEICRDFVQILIVELLLAKRDSIDRIEDPFTATKFTFSDFKERKVFLRFTI